MTTPPKKTITNGVDLDALNKTIKAIQANPELGKSTFRARNKWISGGHNRTQITCFKCLGAEKAHLRPMDLDADVPNDLGGADDAANPIEHLLNALAGCVTTSMVAHAAVRGIEIEEIESQIEGDIDLRGFLGLDSNVSKGYQAIRIRFRVKTAPENIPKLKVLAEFSPVYNTLLAATKIDIQIVLK
jgi:uncharacterized OsmC-like protein